MTTDQLYKLSLLQDIAQNPATSKVTTADIPTDVNALLENAARLAAGNTNTNGQAVRSIFSNLTINGQTAPAARFFPVQALTLGYDLFPAEKPSSATSIAAVFQADFQKIKGNDRAFAETLLHVLHKYTSTIPSGRGEDVSLYDFAKSKAGMAVCLWRFKNDARLPEEIRDDSNPVLLVGGGISGIQKFIYDIIGANASKNLKGRSYYLHLLADSVVRYVIRRLNLYYGNVITASGGKFKLLAPNTLEVRKQLAALKNEMSNAIFEKYATRLSLELEWTPISLTELETARIGDVFGRLENKVSAAKHRKHESQLNPTPENGNQGKGYAFFFEPSEMGGDAARDTITGEELTVAELERNSVYHIEGALPTLATDRQKAAGENLTAYDTAQQIFLGKSLRKCDIRFIGHGQQFTGIGKVDEIEDVFNPGGLPEYHYILSKEFRQKLMLGQIGADFLAINDLEEFSRQIGAISSNTSATYGFELYGGNKFPYIRINDKKGESLDVVKTFSELAGLSDEEFPGREYMEPELFPDIKFKRLAILRMDVDNLGHVFKKGFQVEGTPARYYALSRQLDWFFKGYLNTLWQEGETQSPTGKKYPWKDYVQITYAGGDDLFVVGKWDCVLEFALRIRQDFKAWVCHHPGLDISGSVTVVTPKFPVYSAARQGEKDEKLAKNHFYPLLDKLKEEQRRSVTRTGKQSFTLFGVPLNWGNEFDLVLRLRSELTKHIERPPTKTLIQQIQNFQELRNHQQKNNLTESWRWQLAYQISRAVERYNLGSEDFFKELPKGVFCNRCKYTEGSNWEYNKDSSRDFLTFLSLAARWVEFEHRDFQKEKKNK